jgi:hypothetical protein
MTLKERDLRGLAAANAARNSSMIRTRTTTPKSPRHTNARTRGARKRKKKGREQSRHHCWWHQATYTDDRRADGSVNGYAGNDSGRSGTHSIRACPVAVLVEPGDSILVRVTHRRSLIHLLSRAKRGGMIKKKPRRSRRQSTRASIGLEARFRRAFPKVKTGYLRRGDARPDPGARITSSRRASVGRTTIRCCRVNRMIRTRFGAVLVAGMALSRDHLVRA